MRDSKHDTALYLSGEVVRNEQLRGEFDYGCLVHPAENSDLASGLAPKASPHCG